MRRDSARVDEPACARFNRYSSRKMFHRMTGIRCDLMVRITLAHEIDRIPVVFGELDIFLIRKPPGQVFVPVLWLGHIAFFVGIR